MNDFLKNIFVWLVLGSIIFLVFNNVEPTAPRETISYSQFKQEVLSDRVSEVTYKGDQMTIFGQRLDGSKFKTNHPIYKSDPVLDAALQENGVITSYEEVEQPSVWSQLLVGAFPILLLLAIFFFFMRQMQGSMSGRGGPMSFGKSKAKLMEGGKVKTTFKDVAGCEEAKQDVQELVDYLKDPTRFQKVGGKIPRGVLMVGPPGTGKTLLARATAGEARVPFFSISGSDFVEMFVGVGASRVRDMFDQAKKNSPCIVFIDEIDAVGRHRGAGLGGGHDEREQTLNQLLVEMDGFEANQGVILMAATNRPDVLDPALLRPGRFDRQVIVGRPDLAGRTQILKVHAKDKPLAKNVNFETLAKQTPGFTGADLANLLNEAALLAARKNKKTIGIADIENSIDRVMAGPEKKSQVMTEEEKLIIAYHETGHALVGWALPNADPIHKVTIIPRGRALGYTQALPDSEKYLSSKAELKDRLAMLMGGRVAEELIFADPTTGASNDIEKATDIARRMVMEFGMSEKLGPMLYGKGSNEVFLGRDYGRQQDYSDEVASSIDDEVRNLLNDAHIIAGKILKKFKKQMDAMVNLLMEKETINKDEVAEVFKAIKKVKIQGTGKSLRLA